jgi:hypothetical protein
VVPDVETKKLVGYIVVNDAKLEILALGYS